MDEHLFVEALTLIAAEMKFREKNPSSIERICHLMERMSQSAGPGVVRKAGIRPESHDMLSRLREKYPQYFTRFQKPDSLADIWGDRLLFK